MADIDHNTVEALSSLSRIDLTPEEKGAIKNDLEKILRFMDQLAEVSTDGVEPTYHVAKDLVNVVRSDDELEKEVAKEELFDRATFLSLAPDQVAGMIRVPNFMEGKEE